MRPISENAGYCFFVIGIPTSLNLQDHLGKTIDPAGQRAGKSGASKQGSMQRNDEEEEIKDEEKRQKKE